METNYEHFKKEIDKLFSEEKDIGFDIMTNKVCECSDVETCEECKFNAIKGSYGCANRLAMWLVSEYKDPVEDVDWSKVPVDTPVLVRDTGDMWYKRYFAKYENGRVYTFAMGLTSWTAEGYDHTGFMYAKLANPEDCKSAFHAEEKELTKEERMAQLSAIYKDSCVKSAWKEMVEAVDKFWQSDIDDEKKDKIVNMVMMLLRMER